MSKVWRHRAIAIAIVMVLAIPNVEVKAFAASTRATSSAVAAAAPPAGFRDERVAGGSDLPSQFRLSAPTGMAFLPGGRILVAEKAGKLRVIKSGVVQPTPVFDISAQVYNAGDGGLIGVTPDPQFSTNGFIYVTYKSDNPREGRVSRFTMSGDVAPLTSEVILLRTIADDDSHQIDSVQFGSDGLLYVSHGDSSPFAGATVKSTRSQQANQSVGKIFRMTAAGKGVASNPFWTGNADDVASKVFALGLRNPFRFTVRPDGTVIVGDVGWNSAEEIDKIVPGVGNHNYGWPCYEGNVQRSEFSTFPICQTLNAQGPTAVTAPSFAYDHSVGSSITGGPVYSSTVFPAPYRGAYFYGDYSHSWINYWPMDASGNFVGQPVRFSDADSPVDIQLGPDGALYYVSINKGQVRRIAYGSPSSCAAGNYFAQYYTNMTWSGTPAISRCDDAINYDWGLGSPFGGNPVDQYSVNWSGSQYFAKGVNTVSATSDDGMQVWVDGALVIDNGGDHPAITKSANLTYTAAGFHNVVAKYYENGAYASAKVTITSANSAPVPVIKTPTDGAQFTTKQAISATGSATDTEDGTLTGNSLQWDVILHHCPPPSGSTDVCHTHPESTFKGTGGTITGVDINVDWVWLEVRLTATDSGGLSSTATVRLFPKLCAAGAARGQYYPNQTWSGAPTLTRCESLINYDWGTGGPFAAGGPVDNFSTEWHVPTYFPAGATAMNVSSDDGTQVYVDGVLEIDNTGIHPPINKTDVLQYAKAGWHDVYIRYVEVGGGAVAEFNTSAACPNNQFRGAYYTNTNWSGAPALTRCDANLNFDWSTGGPFGASPVDNYSAEWYAANNFAAGATTVTLSSDDGAQLWIDGTLVIDNGGVHPSTSKSVTLNYASAGWHTIKVRYIEATGFAQVAYSHSP